MRIRLFLHPSADGGRPDPELPQEEQTKEMILSGMGQIHIEVAVEKMKTKFGVEVKPENT